MESLNVIKRRIKSTECTKQMTKAMEMVAASKMRKSQEWAIKARPFAKRALELLCSIYKRKVESHFLLEKREMKNFCLIIITSDKGLCGALNSNVLKTAEKFLQSRKEKNVDIGNIDIVSIGKKGEDFAKKQKIKIIKNLAGTGEIAYFEDIHPLSDFLIKAYKEKKYDLICCAYTNFVSTLEQKATIKQILPIRAKELRDIIKGIFPAKGKYADEKEESYCDPIGYKYYKYQFEPSTRKVLNNLLPTLLKIQFYHMILESNASEHSARMVAMKKASDTADDLLSELNILYNKIRQSAITRELTEISATKEALSS